MLFFRSISLVAALAFATLSSAVPVDVGVVPEIVARHDVTELALRGATGSVPQLYSTCHDNVVEIIANIQIAIEADVIDQNEVLGYFDEIVAQINIVIGGVQWYQTNEVGLDVILALDGSVITVDVLGGIIYDLFSIIVNILALVVVKIDISATVVLFGGLLCQLLQVTLLVVVDLNVVLVVVLEPLRDVLGNLNILDVFIGIGISL